MKVEQQPTETPEQIIRAAEAWLVRQREILAKAHGSSWSTNRHWIEAYLLEEVRRRLIARGWRPKA